MKKITMLKVRPSLVQGLVPKVELAVVELKQESESSNEMLDFCYKEIGCDLIEYATFGNPYEEKHFNAIVDEEGLLKSDNIVMSLTLPVDDTHTPPIELQLCGTVLLSKSKYDEDEGLVEIGLTREDIEHIKNNLVVKFVGVTR